MLDLGSLGLSSIPPAKLRVPFRYVKDNQILLLYKQRHQSIVQSASDVISIKRHQAQRFRTNSGSTKQQTFFDFRFMRMSSFKFFVTGSYRLIQRALRGVSLCCGTVTCHANT